MMQLINVAKNCSLGIAKKKHALQSGITAESWRINSMKRIETSLWIGLLRIARLFLALL